MTRPVVPAIRRIHEMHLEELAYLWPQRNRALRSPDYTLAAFRYLESRVEAHLDGLRVAGDSVASTLEDALTSDDSDVAGAAAMALMQSNVPAAWQQVARSIEKSKGSSAFSITQAIAHAPKVPAAALWDVVLAASQSQVPEIASGSTFIIALHRPEELAPARLTPLLTSKIAEVRSMAWRTVIAAEIQIPRGFYDRAMADEDSTVQYQAVVAAAWTQQTWLARYLKNLDADAAQPGCLLWLLGVLAKPDDESLIMKLASAPTVGVARFRMAGAFGSSTLIDLLLNQIQSKNPADAAAAGTAFSKITGKIVRSDQRVMLPVPACVQPDAFEEEFAEEVTLPDFQMAAAHWKQVRSNYKSQGRWCRGHDLSKSAGLGTSRELLDMESHWEMHLRAKFNGRWNGRLGDFEQYPISAPPTA